jgi:spoIIIJ-associated protein
MEQQIQRGQKCLEEMLQLMGFSGVQVTAKILDGESPYWLIIDETKFTSEQLEHLIGARGENLDAIQYLVNTMVNMGLEPEQQQPLTVELAGYRVRRQSELFALAEKVARQVRATGREESITDLSSAERRQIHNYLKDARDLETESQGQDPYRRLVVRLR